MYFPASSQYDVFGFGIPLPTNFEGKHRKYYRIKRNSKYKLSQLLVAVRLCNFVYKITE